MSVRVTRTAQASWRGDLADGGGRIGVGSGAYEGPFTLRARVEDVERSTNPEELIGAAHAGCFTMSLANLLTESGHPPADLQTTAKVRLEQLETGFAITNIALETVGEVPGVDADDVRDAGPAGQGHLPRVPRARRHGDHAGGEACKRLTRAVGADGPGSSRRSSNAPRAADRPRARARPRRSCSCSRGRASCPWPASAIAARARDRGLPRARRGVRAPQPNCGADARGLGRESSTPFLAIAAAAGRIGPWSARLADQEEQDATTSRTFRIVADPSTGLRSATHFVGYMPTGTGARPFPHL